jgi:hypothetical protein
MTRPTSASQREQAEEWMLTTFGQRMGDYLSERRTEPLGLAVVEVDRVLKVARIRQLLAGWRSEDVLSAAGRKPIMDETAALSLILLQIRINQPTLITELSHTFLKLSPRQRAVLRLTHDGLDERVYERIWAALQRLIALVDEFPGRRDKVLTEAEYRKVKANRDPEQCRIRRTRMWTLANDLLHGSWLLLPEELRDRSHGNQAIDATFVPLQGRRGTRRRGTSLATVGRPILMAGSTAATAATEPSRTLMPARSRRRIPARSTKAGPWTNSCGAWKSRLPGRRPTRRAKSTCFLC